MLPRLKLCLQGITSVGRGLSPHTIGLLLGAVATLNRTVQITIETYVLSLRAADDLGIMDVPDATGIAER